MINLRAIRKTSKQEASRLPELLMIAQKTADNLLHAHHKKYKSGQGEEFWQFRPYTVLDPASRIDWRQSARTDKLYVRQKEHEAAQKYLLWCQNNNAMDFQSKQPRHQSRMPLMF